MTGPGGRAPARRDATEPAAAWSGLPTDPVRWHGPSPPRRPLRDLAGILSAFASCFTATSRAQDLPASVRSHAWRIAVGHADVEVRSPEHGAQRTAGGKGA